MSAFPVSDANMIPDPFVVLDDKFDALDAPHANELAGSTVNVQLVELRKYRHEEPCLSVGQIADSRFAPRNVQACQVKSLVSLMGAPSF